MASGLSVKYRHIAAGAVHPDNGRPSLRVQTRRQEAADCTASLGYSAQNENRQTRAGPSISVRVFKHPRVNQGYTGVVKLYVTVHCNFGIGRLAVIC